jgi:general secretion pathway protein G
MAPEEQIEIEPAAMDVAAPAVAQAHSPVAPETKRQNAVQRGFSLIELIVVVTIIGILAAVAVINIQNAARKARETALKDNLFKMRQAIDNFYADKQRYPSDLNELVPRYLKFIPKDPITQQGEWDQIVATPEPDDQPTEEEQQAGPGITDVKSLAPGNTLDGTPYADL